VQRFSLPGAIREGREAVKEGGMMEDSTNESNTVTIDEGFRSWYAACPCCLGESHPDVKAALEREGLGRGAVKGMDRERAG
jgi:hypothetical protein